jgi:hypothetical protein
MKKVYKKTRNSQILSIKMVAFLKFSICFLEKENKNVTIFLGLTSKY